MVMNKWFKSSFSGPWTDNCVEVQWRKSSLTDNTCVEVQCNCHVDEILVRDSKDPGGPVLKFTRDEWKAFIAGAKNNEFDVSS